MNIITNSLIIYVYVALDMIALDSLFWRQIE